MPYIPPKPRRRKLPIGLVVRSSLLAGLLGVVVVASDRLWQEMVSRQAFAATAATGPKFDGHIEQFVAPRDYLTLPPQAESQLELRGGPGADYAGLGLIGPEEVLTGTGTAMAGDGEQWILVMRPDGVSGFVAQKALIATSEMVAPVECPPGKMCDEGMVSMREYMVGARYRELYGSSNATGRKLLEAGHRIWEAERIGCNQLARPSACRLEASAKRMNALDGFAIGVRT